MLHAPDGVSMAQGLDRILRRTERRANKPLRKLHDTLASHRAAILALGEHRPAAGRIEAVNTTWESLVRRARGYRDHDYLLPIPFSHHTITFPKGRAARSIQS